MNKGNTHYIHSEAIVDSLHIGSGTRIWRNVHIMKGAIIGKNCNICEGCYIENHVSIGDGVTIKNNVSLWDNIILEDNVFIGPNATFTNDPWPRAFNKKTSRELESTVVKKGATIGANSTIVCNLTIHEYAFVGAGSVVTQDVHAYNIVYGNPASFKGIICRCSKKIPSGSLEYKCSCGLTYLIQDSTVRNIL